jgi:hypothetical protein
LECFGHAQPGNVSRVTRDIHNADSALTAARDRYQRNLRFEKEVEALRGSRTDIYPVTVTVIKANGHTGLPDRDLIKNLHPAVRNPVTRSLKPSLRVFSETLARRGDPAYAFCAALEIGKDKSGQLKLK